MSTQTKVANPSEVLVFLKAKTAEELVKLQLENNHNDGRQYIYSNPQFVKGDWYVWFYKDFSDAIKKAKIDKLKAEEESGNKQTSPSAE